MVGTTGSRINMFMQRFHNLGLMETNADRFLVIKEVKFADYLAQIVEPLGMSARCAIILFKTVQLLDKGSLPN